MTGATYSTPNALTCPGCSRPMGAATNLTGVKAPEPGDVGICFGCGEVVMYDETMALIVCTDTELREDPAVVAVRAKLLGFEREGGS